MSTASLGSLVIELAANTAKLQSDLGRATVMAENAARKMASSFKSALGGIAIGAVVEEIFSAVDKSAKFGDAIAKAALKTGIGTSAIQELAYAAKQGNVDLTQLTTGLKKMQVAVSQAASGNKEVNQTLAALGIHISDLLALSPDQQFERIAQGISELKDPADRARAAVNLFGRAGTDLLPIFEGGADGVRKFRQEAREMGVVLSAIDIGKLKDADESIKRMEAAFSGLWNTIISKVSPAFADFFDSLRRGFGGATERETQIAKLEEQMLRLSQAKELAGARGAASSLVGTDESRQKQIEALQARIDLLQNPTKDEGRRPTRGDTATGFKEAKKAAADYSQTLETITAVGKDITLNQLQNERAIAGFRKETELANQRIAEGKSIYEETRTSAERYAETIANLKVLLASGAIDQDTFARAAKQAADKTDTFANSLKGSLHAALDDIVRTGKFNMHQFINNIIAELASTQLKKAIDALVDDFAGIFSGKGGGGGLGGILGGIIGGIGSIFGFASGGRPPAGRASIVGERGPELFIPDSAGTIIPNSVGGRAITLVNAPVYNIAAGVTRQELVPLLRQTNEASIKQMGDLIRRGRYI